MDGRATWLGSPGHVPRDVWWVTGVFDVEVWGLPLRVLLPGLPHQMESHLNTSEQLCVSALCGGIVTHCFELGGPSRVAWDVVPPEGGTSARSGQGCCHLGLSECSGTGEEAAMRADACSEGGSLWGLSGVDIGACPIRTW